MWLKGCVNCVFAIYGRVRSFPQAWGFNLLAERKVLGRKSEKPACNRAKQPVKALKVGIVL